MPGCSEESQQAKMHRLFPSAGFRILEHNNALTDLEKHAAEKWIQEMEEAEANSHAEQLVIDEEIKHLLERKSTLQEQDRNRKLAVELYRKKVYAPIRRIPFEVLSEIALYCVSEIPKIHIIFSHVCRMWREAALSTPRMWTALQIRLKDVNFVHQDIELVRIWFERAKGRPTVSFFVDFAPRFYYSEYLNNQGFSHWKTTPAGTLLRSLTDISPRFRHLRISSAVDDSRPVFQLPETWDLRRLECLEIDTMFATNSAEDTFLTSDYHFPATPVLTLVMMESSAVRNHQIRALFPWTQLKCVKIWPVDITMSEWVSVMLSCVSIETGIFSLQEVESSDILLPPSYSGHNELQNLSLAFTDSDEYSPIAILKAFRFPRLVNLDIIGYDDPFDGPFVELDRPLNSLRRISIGGRGGPRQYIPGLLKMTPQLVELSIEAITPILTDILTYNVRTPDQNILTELRTIHMEYICRREYRYIQKLMNAALSSRAADGLPHGCRKLSEINLLVSNASPNQLKRTEEKLLECLTDGTTLNMLRSHTDLPLFVLGEYTGVRLGHLLVGS